MFMIMEKTDAPEASLEEFQEFFPKGSSSVRGFFLRRHGAPFGMTLFYPGQTSLYYRRIACAPESKNAKRSSFASSLMTISTPKGVSSLVRDETREESFGFFESGLAQGGHPSEKK
jgi:hypothetical protein